MIAAKPAAIKPDRLQHIPAGVVQLDTDYRLVLANAKARQYIADLGKATVGDRVLSLGGTPIETLLIPRSDDLPHEVVLAGLPSRIFAIRARALPATDVAGWVLLIQDVTVERHLQDQQAHQDRLAAMERLAAGIANVARAPVHCVGEGWCTVPLHQGIF